MSLSLVALIIACVALGLLAVRAYIILDRLRRRFENYNPNPVYGARRRKVDIWFR